MTGECYRARVWVGPSSHLPPPPSVKTAGRRVERVGFHVGQAPSGSHVADKAGSDRLLWLGDGGRWGPCLGLLGVKRELRHRQPRSAAQVEQDDRHHVESNGVRRECGDARKLPARRVDDGDAGILGALKDRGWVS